MNYVEALDVIKEAIQNKLDYEDLEILLNGLADISKNIQDKMVVTPDTRLKDNN